MAFLYNHNDVWALFGVQETFRLMPCGKHIIFRICNLQSGSRTSRLFKFFILQRSLVHMAYVPRVVKTLIYVVVRTT